MATVRKAARGTGARRAGGKLKRSPARGKASRRVAAQHTQRGARAKKGTVRGRVGRARRKESRPGAAGNPGKKPQRLQRRGRSRSEDARLFFGEELLRSIEAPPKIH